MEAIASGNAVDGSAGSPRPIRARGDARPGLDGTAPLMNRLIAIFERYVVLVLLALMMVAVFAATIELGAILAQQLLEPPFLLLNLEELLEVFGFFLMVLIGLELLETIRAYLEQDKVHVEVVFLVAMVAVARKVIIVDLDAVSADTLFAMSAVILALSAGYFLLGKALNARRNGPPPPGSDSP